MHPDGDVADAGPGVEPDAQRPERSVVRGQRAPGEAERRHKESAALVEHGLVDELVRPLQHRWGDREPKGLGRLDVNHELELRRLLHR